MNDQVVESEHNAQTGAEETTKDSNFYDVTKIMKSKAFETKYEKVFLGDCPIYLKSHCTFLNIMYTDLKMMV